MQFTKLTKIALTTAALAITGFSAQAITIDFGTSWPTGFPGIPYTTDPLDRVLGTVAGQTANETAIKNLLNDMLGTTFVAADIHKTNQPAEVGPPDGYFSVPGGYKYLAVQYDGPNGGTVVIQLDGNDAKVPFDSAAFWTGPPADSTADKHAVSHFALAGVVSPTPRSVPDGGTTLAMLGMALSSLSAVAYARRKLAASAS